MDNPKTSWFSEERIKDLIDKANLKYNEKYTNDSKRKLVYVENSVYHILMPFNNGYAKLALSKLVDALERQCPNNYNTLKDELTKLIS